MSAFDDARVLLFIADYAAADAGGKLNAIGAGFNITALDPTQRSPAQHLAVVIDVPRRYVGTDFPVSIELRRVDTDEAVMVPGPTGQLEAMRVQQVVRPEMPGIPQGAQMPEHMYSRLQFVLAFPLGLQLMPNVTYRWRVEIEAQTRPHWDATFHVLGPAPGMVFGGPSAPPDPDMPRWDDGPSSQ